MRLQQVPRTQLMVNINHLRRGDTADVVLLIVRKPLNEHARACPTAEGGFGR